MDTSDSVVVYNFSCFELGSDRRAIPPYKASRQAIEQMPSAFVLEGTAEEVPRESLDAKGRYRRLATGWGDLMEV